MSFDWLIYKELNPDLKQLTAHQLRKHYLENGKKEGRKYSVYELYPDFNALVYKKNYTELEKYSISQIELHWLVIGRKEKRSYHIVENDKNKGIEKTVLDKKIVICVNNKYNLDFVELEKYMYVMEQLLQKIAYVTQEDNIELIHNLCIEYVVNISAGDLITQKYVEENIQYMKDNEMCVLKPRFFHYMGENQVYRITTKSLNTFIDSGIIYKRGIDLSNSQYINNTNDELMIKYLKSENEILNDCVYDYEITDNNMMKAICKESNIERMIRILKGVKSKKAYITFLDMTRLDYDYMLRLQLYVTRLLQYDFDIIEIQDVSKYNMGMYEVILLDANVFNTKSTKLQHNLVYGYLSVLEKCKNNVMITHDLHDWSFGFSDKPQDYEYVDCSIHPSNRKRGVSGPCNDMTLEKTQLKTTLASLHIKSIISIYDCPEFDYMKESFSDVISNFYTLHHFVSTPIYHLPKVIIKNIDVLFYGMNDTTYYLFRHRLLNIVKDHFNVTQINRKSRFDPDICENGLANYISRSWITVSCISNFSYAVRKFNEISECGSVVLGNTNYQIDNIIGDGMLRLDENMSDTDIIKIVRIHLDKKILLVYLGFKSRKNVAYFNDNNYVMKLRNILDYNTDVDYPKVNIIPKKLNKTAHKKVYNNLFILEELGDLLIEINLVNNNVLDNNIGCLINTEYYRSVIINDTYYIYIDDSKGELNIKLITEQNIQTIIYNVFQN